MIEARPEKAIIIGMDGMIPEMLQKFSAEGILPHLTRLMKAGIFSKSLPAAPTDTPTNWSCLSTGASPGVHGVNGFNVHYPGEPFERWHGSRQNITRDLLCIFKMPPGQEPLNQICRAEHVWESAKRADKKTILVNWPGGWPPTVEDTIVIDGTGPFSSPLSRLGEPTFFVAGEPPTSGHLVPLEIREAQGWQNALVSGSPPLETALLIGGEGAVGFAEGEWRVQLGASGSSLALLTIYHPLFLDSQGQGFDRVLICRTKNAADLVVALRQGEWSPWLDEDLDFETIRHADGYTVKEPYPVRVQTTVKFRLQLTHLSSDGQQAALYRTALFNTRGWAHPPSVADELLEHVFQIDMKSSTGLMPGPESSGEVHPATPYAVVHESVEAQARALAMICACLTERHPWDLLMVQIHAPDSLNHHALGDLLVGSPTYEPSKEQSAWERFRHEYQVLDSLVGDILRDCADEKTLVVCVSDHGCIPARKAVWLGDAFIRAGLTVYVEDPTTGKLIVDWTRSKAMLTTFPWGHGVWVNLKGRDPQGIVEPGSEYETVRTEAINALLSVIDPETGQRPVAVALRREDATLLGLGGDRTPDCVFAFTPGYCDRYDMFGGGPLDPELVAQGAFPETNKLWYIRGMHHCYLPTATYGGFSNCGILIMSGPGIKQGYQRSGSVWTTDLVPTLAHLLDVPLPAQADGKIIADILTI